MTTRITQIPQKIFQPFSWAGKVYRKVKPLIISALLMPAGFALVPDSKGKGAEAPKSNLVFQGAGNGLFEIVNNVPLITHASQTGIEVITRSISEEDVPFEIARLEALQPKFAQSTSKKDFLALLAGSFIGKASALVKTNQINAEAALDNIVKHYCADQVKKGEKYKVKKQNVDQEIIRVSRDVPDDGKWGLKHKKLDELDEAAERYRSDIERNGALIDDLAELLERMILELNQQTIQDANDGHLAEGAVHGAPVMTWAEINRHYTEGARGFVFDVNLVGPVSHPFIFAHAAEIPMVVLENPLDKLGSATKISIDSRTGRIYVNPQGTTLTELGQRSVTYRKLAKLYKDNFHCEVGWTLDQQPLPRLNANIKDRSDLEPKKMRSQRVGLFRTEGLYLRERPPVTSLVRMFKDVIRKTDAANIRLFDIAPDKMPKDLNSNHPEYRKIIDRTLAGTEFLLNSELGQPILDDQLKALLIAYCRLMHKDNIPLKDKTVRIILPQVAQPQEIRDVKARMEKIEQALLAEGVIRVSVRNNIQVGVMIETAAAISNIELLAAESNFFSIGGNDLTMGLLGFTERNKLMTGPRYDWLSPVVLNSIKKAIDVAKKTGIRVSFCGEMARDPMGAIVLTLMGIDSLSMDNSYIPEIHYLLSNIHLGEWQSFSSLNPNNESVVEILLKFQDAMQVRQYLFDLVTKKTHADTRLALENMITSARPATYKPEE
ncbi:MAG: hypothetical protein PHH14_07445 [Candidatus Margulisbacteria bacterium]|nr:hypothetical protein [Candidatus Margulisiibacteriota bacterium]